MKRSVQPVRSPSPPSALDRDEPKVTPKSAKDHLHVRRSRRKTAHRSRPTCYHSWAARSLIISQVVDTVALVRTLVGDVYYRNDSMNCGPQMSVGSCFRCRRHCGSTAEVDCTHVKSTGEEEMDVGGKSSYRFFTWSVHLLCLKG
jgi:hypothetical protein